MSFSTSTDPILWIEYRRPNEAHLSWAGEGPWEQLRNILLSYSTTTRLIGGTQGVIPWGEFTGLVEELRKLRGAFPFSVTYSDQAKLRLRKASDLINLYLRIAELPVVSPDEIQERLKSVGFTRPLKPFQLINVGKLLRLPAGATFSVPGAGKTSEALAYFFAKPGDHDRLLVAAPINAFAAWEEQLTLSLPGSGYRFTRLQGGVSRIRDLLATDPKFMLVGYQQLPNIRELIASMMETNSTAFFLDESHRIKAGRGAVTADTVLSLAHLPSAKLVMSGTPMPQSENDLLPQFSFLFPEIDPRGKSPADLIRPVFVRTTKAELGLREPDRRVTTLPMNNLQRTLYDLIRSETLRQVSQLNLRSRQHLRQLGRSIVRLLQLAANPALLAEELGSMHPELVRGVVREGDSPKLRWACRRARELVESGQKVIIWTSFVRNVELIATRLADLQSEFIHGSVESGPEDESETREARIRRFHDASMVLVANPAAASEGISLHTVCHHAIFVDRTFNAAHYIQAEDRIHRIGLSRMQATTIEILVAEDSVDEVVQLRLNAKIALMAQILNDPSLGSGPISFESLDEESDEVGGLSEDDLKEVLNHLRSAQWLTR